MENDNTELIIEHGGDQATSATETGEVDINVQDIEQKSVVVVADSLEPKLDSDSESEPEPDSDSEPADLVDEIQAKMNSYPLPTPAISEMLPPTPPVVEHDDQA